MGSIRGLVDLRQELGNAKTEDELLMIWTRCRSGMDGSTLMRASRYVHGRAEELRKAKPKGLELWF